MARRIRWQILIAAVSALVVVVLLAQLALSTTARSEPLVGGSYTEALASLPEQLIPHLNDPLNDPGGRTVGTLLFDGLTRIGPDGLPESALATTWQIEQEGETYLFSLRDDVTWHDGTPFSADDVVFTVRAVQDERFPGDPALARLWEGVLVDRLDATTVRFTLNAPFAPFVHAARLPMLPAHLLADLPPDEWATSAFAQQPVGTGPYQISARTTEEVTLRANADYFRGRPFIDEITLRLIDAPQVALSLLTEGRIQAYGASSAEAPELTQVDLPPTITRISLPLDSYATVSFNMRRPPLDDLDLRRALAHGLDKAALLEQIFGGQVAGLNTPILPGWWAADPTLTWYDHAPRAAATLLDDLGYTLDADNLRRREDRPLRLPILTDNDPGRLAAARELARQWAALGIETTVEEVDTATLQERLRDHDFAAAVHGWARLGADPDVFALWHSTQAQDGLNYAGLQDAETDAALEAGRTSTDIATRNLAYAAFQARWIDQVPGITLYQPLYTFAVRDAVGGLGFAPGDLAESRLLVGREDRYRSVPRWFVNSAREIRGTLR